MGYPIVSDWIKIKKRSENEYLVKDLIENEWYRIDPYSAWFVRHLNGKTDPYKIDSRLSKSDVDELLFNLSREGIIRDYRFLSKSFLQFYVTLWRPRVTEKLKVLASVTNTILLISWLPVLIFSIYYFAHHLDNFSSQYATIGGVVWLIIGIFFHEAGHMIACLAYGGSVFEIGAFIEYFLPGAYVLMDRERIKPKLRRVQVSAAGIEMNFLLSGILLILSANSSALSGFFFGGAFNNAFVGLLNLTGINGFDGMTILGELLGIEDLVGRAKKLTKNKYRRKRLSKTGISGKATVALCYTIRFIQIALPLILAVNIIGVISWFL